jgi:hypothetical protein
MDFTSKLWHKALPESVSPHGEKIQTFSKNFPRSKDLSDTSKAHFELNKDRIV